VAQSSCSPSSSPSARTLRGLRSNGNVVHLDF
jgi:hypothetical protein